MNAVRPATLIAFKRWLSTQADRDAMKRRRDVLLADTTHDSLTL
jgi:hypothetical protein